MHLRDGLETHQTVRQAYDHLVSTAAIDRDPAQELVVARLDALIADIAAKRPAQKSSALLIIFPNEGTSGIYTGKVFEYIASGTPVLLVPSDRGVIADLLEETGTGTACDTIEETVAYLEKAHARWKGGEAARQLANDAAVAAYSYRVLAGKLAGKLESLEKA